MVQFDKNTFTITVSGDKSEYLETIKTLLDSIVTPTDGESNNKERYYLCNLIECMLPSEKQLINESEAEYLETIKKQKLNSISSFTPKDTQSNG